MASLFAHARCLARWPRREELLELRTFESWKIESICVRLYPETIECCSTARRRVGRAEFAICEQIVNFLLTNCERKVYIHFPNMYNYTVEVNKYS